VFHCTRLGFYLGAPQTPLQGVSKPICTRLVAIALVGLMSLALAACGSSDGGSAPATGKAIKNVTFMAGFKPQANLPFVGAYIAQEKGYFKDQALNVTIRHAQSGEHLQLLLAGEIQFSTANGAQVLSRNDQGLPLQAIALIGQKSEQGFAVGASSGINSVKDWEGKTFGYKGSVPAEFLAIVRANNLDPSKVKQVSVGFDPRVLSEGRVDILPVFFSNEPDTLNNIGYKTKLFDPDDYGVSALGLSYVSTKDYVAKDPDATERFLRAVLKAVAWADTNRNEALDIVMKYAPQEDKEHQRFMLNTELDRAMTDAAKKNGIGWQTREQWQGMADMLLQFQVLKKQADVPNVFYDAALKKIYKDGKMVE
jgi:ABC-type nitrate/sulfonate/bicarbonate transport system substrate-binding protein